jgi:hypothetical protein
MQKQPIPKKGRNLKNLAVNTSGKPGQKPAGPHHRGGSRPPSD